MTVTSNGLTERTMTDGDLLIRSSAPPAITEPSPQKWYLGWEEVLKLVPDGPHWVRLFYGQVKQKRLVLEVLLDNNEWTEALEVMEGLEWPSSEEYLSLRLFAVIQTGSEMGRSSLTEKPWWKLW